MHERKRILPEQPDGQGRIHHDPNFNYYTRICRKYNLAEKSHIGYTYVRLRKGMYEPRQEGQIAHENLVKYLEPYGYHRSRKTSDYENTTVEQ